MCWRRAMGSRMPSGRDTSIKEIRLPKAPIDSSCGRTFTGTMGRKNPSNPQSNIGTGVGGTAVNITADRPNVLAPPSSFQPSISQWIDTTAFALQPYGTPGNEGRNVFYGPPQRKVDFSLFKDFSLKESVTDRKSVV